MFSDKADGGQVPDAAREERERKRREYAVLQARGKTRELRYSDLPRWQRLRSCLDQEGVDPSDAVVCRMHDEDVKLEFGIVVVRDGRAFSFEVNWHKDAAGRDVPSYEDAWVSEWEEMDDRRRALYARDLEVGRFVLETDIDGDR